MHLLPSLTSFSQYHYNLRLLHTNRFLNIRNCAQLNICNIPLELTKTNFLLEPIKASELRIRQNPIKGQLTFRQSHQVYDVPPQEARTKR